MRAKKFFLNCIGLVAAFAFSLAEEEKLEYRVLVEARSSSQTFSENFKSVQVISAEELKKMPVSDLNSALTYVAGLFLQARANPEIQADLSLRGSTFEQVLIMVDGFPLKDSQTGHHLLQLPLTLAEVEKIEVLRGSAARIYGGNAFSGVINIITRQSKSDNFLNGMLQVSERNTLKLAGLVNINILKTTAAFSLSQSDGFFFNNDYQQRVIHLKSMLKKSDSFFQLQTGYLWKDFGANGFYSDRFPLQRERIANFFAGAEYYRNSEKISWRSRFNLRLNRDLFWLNHLQPDFYFNQHRNYYYNFLNGLTVVSKFGLSNINFEIEKDTLESNRLGQRQRLNFGLLFDHKTDLSEKLSLSAGFSLYKYSNQQWQLFPGIDLLWKAGKFFLFFSANRSFRLPTYTELYYQDPLHRADSGLKPENSFELESGIKLNQKPLTIQVALFRRKNYNLIDWFWQESEKLWQSKNLKSSVHYGIDFELAVNMREIFDRSFFSGLKLASSFLKVDDISGIENSKYAYNYLQRQIVLNLELEPFKNFYCFLAMRNEKEFLQPSRFIFDSRMLWKIDKKITFFLDGYNLSNRFYFGAGKTPALPRHISAGVNFNLY